MIECLYIHADEAISYIDHGWHVEMMPAHWPYCLAWRNPPLTSRGGDA